MKFTIALLFLATSAYSYVDLSLQYSFNKRKSLASTTLEEDGEAISKRTTVSVNWAWYIWSQVALELNYSKIEENTTDSRKRTIDTNFDILNSEVDTVTEVKGAGLRLSFAKQNARFIPSLSFGYAELTTNGVEQYKVDNNGAIRNTGELKLDEETSASSYITAGLRIRFTKLMGLNFTAKSVMRDFEFSEASKNVTYAAGLSWIF